MNDQVRSSRPNVRRAAPPRNSDQQTEDIMDVRGDEDEHVNIRAVPTHTKEYKESKSNEDVEKPQSALEIEELEAPLIYRDTNSTILARDNRRKSRYLWRDVIIIFLIGFGSGISIPIIYHSLRRNE